MDDGSSAISIADEALSAYSDLDFTNAMRLLKDCSAVNRTCAALEAELDFLTTNSKEKLIGQADDGNEEAQYLVGSLYSNLEATDQNLFPEGVLYLYAASTAGHRAALMTMGYRHFHGYGVPMRCETAALNYIEVAKEVAHLYSSGLPQAVELIRLGPPSVTGQKDPTKRMTVAEINMFEQMAKSDASVAHNVAKRFLLGFDGFRQDYAKALSLLEIHSHKHAPSLSLQGYMHCLGLGVPNDTALAERLFTKSLDLSKDRDSLALNGLGFISFTRGDYLEAFSKFNESAHGGSSDGMFNLASLFLSGLGTDQHFQRAFIWFSQALEAGHTPAGFALAVMHLNGIGTGRDCRLAVKLLKEVAERSEWVSQTLQMAYRAGNSATAALAYLKLAEAGHEVSQQNLAHLLDSDDVGSLWGLGKVTAQRFYELSADQGGVGSATSEVKLGDFAYYGKGVYINLDPSGSPRAMPRDEPDYQVAFQHYRKVAGIAEDRNSAAVISAAKFSLGFLYHFGLGTDQDIRQARLLYKESFHAYPPLAVTAEVFLYLHSIWLRWPSFTQLPNAFINDARTCAVVTALCLIPALIYIRRRINT